MEESKIMKTKWMPEFLILPGVFFFVAFGIFFILKTWIPGLFPEFQIESFKEYYSASHQFRPAWLTWIAYFGFFVVLPGRCAIFAMESWADSPWLVPLISVASLVGFGLAIGLSAWVVDSWVLPWAAEKAYGPTWATFETFIEFAKDTGMHTPESTNAMFFGSILTSIIHHLGLNGIAVLVTSSIPVIALFLFGAFD
jgi:hypothetical protein